MILEKILKVFSLLLIKWLSDKCREKRPFSWILSGILLNMLPILSGISKCAAYYNAISPGAMYSEFHSNTSGYVVISTPLHLLWSLFRRSLFLWNYPKDIKLKDKFWIISSMFLSWFLSPFFSLPAVVICSSFSGCSALKIGCQV